MKYSSPIGTTELQINRHQCVYVKESTWNVLPTSNCNVNPEIYTTLKQSLVAEEINQTQSSSFMAHKHLQIPFTDMRRHVVY